MHHAIVFVLYPVPVLFETVHIDHGTCAVYACIYGYDGISGLLTLGGCFGLTEDIIIGSCYNLASVVISGLFVSAIPPGRSFDGASISVSTVSVILTFPCGSSHRVISA